MCFRFLFECSTRLVFRAKQCFAFPRSLKPYTLPSKRSLLIDPTFLVVYRDDHSDKTILDQTSQLSGLYATMDLYHIQQLTK